MLTPMVCPPASLAPHAAASMVPSWPPLQTVQPRCARRAPSRFAASYSTSPRWARELPKMVITRPATPRCESMANLRPWYAIGNCSRDLLGVSESGHGERDRMVDIVAHRNLESAIRRVLFVEPQSGYSTGFNDTVRVETLGPEYLAASVADVVECELADLRTPDVDLTDR